VPWLRESCRHHQNALKELRQSIKVQTMPNMQAYHKYRYKSGAVKAVFRSLAGMHLREDIRSWPQQFDSLRKLNP
jgi:hypothetical protein